ncbi:MAG: GNAT family N-acetyltransferase [Armatimonadota bacterium]|nr:GNAT family N-acetyltransferase [Armatimonadota bacterium]
MSLADVTCHVLTYPFPEDFVAWYPYIKPEVMRGDEHWLPCLRRVIHEDTPGVTDRMIAARRASGDWCGVVWIQVPETCPELAHFGWFYVEDEVRGAGVGARIIETCLSTLAAEGVQMLMLPTQLGNERAIGMYYRRGWRLSITDPDGGVWMVREPAGFWQEYFTPDPNRPIRASEPQRSDWVALDYLLSRPAAAVRLLPLGLTGSRRFVSFTHDWDAGDHAVARQGGRPAALAAARADDEGSLMDVFGLDRRAMAVAAELLGRSIPQPRAEVAITDSVRRGALEDAGMRLADVHEREVGGVPISLARYVR